MNINNEDIEILKDPDEAFMPDCFEIIREIVVKRKYQIACIEKVELDELPPYWVISNGTGDNDFLKFLKERDVINTEFYSTYRVKTELFPLVIEFLADKPDDYLDHRTNATTSDYIKKEKQIASQKDCYKRCRSRPLPMDSFDTYEPTEIGEYDLITFASKRQNRTVRGRWDGKQFKGLYGPLDNVLSFIKVRTANEAQMLPSFS